MRKKYFLLIIFTLVLISVQSINAQISGTVFRDYNGDGTKQAGEPGKDRVEVYAYSNTSLPGKDVLVAQTTTDANGNYTITSPVYPVRLEFIIPDGFCNMASDQDYPSANLTPGVNTSEVQIANDGEVHNFGIVYPPDFATEDNPRVFLPRFTSGNGLLSGSTANTPAMISFHYKNKGVAPNDGRGYGTDDNIPFDIVALYSQLGTVHGVAYSRQAKKVFTSAFVKRHAGLGPLGGGGIYWIDPEPPYDLNANLNFLDMDALGIATSDEVNPYTDNPPGSSSNTVTFSPVIGTNVERGLSPDRTQPSHDRAAYSQVGKLSFGDLEISEDGRYLYVVNLYDRKLYEIDLTDPYNPVAPTAANAAQKIHGYQIPDPCTENEKGGEYRPFALKIARGKVYVGVTCSGQDAIGNTVAGSNADVTSSVFEFDLSTHTFDSAPLISYDYSYRDNIEPWNAWTDNWVGDWKKGYPLLADIEFDNNGNVLLGIKDLRGDQFGFINYSINPNSTETYSIATVGELLSAVRDANSPSCSYNIQLDPEFYDDNLAHQESSQGALAVHHTSNFDGALSTFLDPVPGYVWAGGVLLYDNQDGSQVYGKGYEVFFYSSSSGVFGKANGLGDLETMEVVPPIEIGNIVWLDKDEDGIQDSDEEGIEGVIVELVKNGQVVSTTTTDNLGTYYFNFTNTNNGEGPEPNTNYTIRISTTQFLNGVGSGPLSLKSLTLTNEVGNGESDWSDNDASDVAGVIQFDITTGNPGENNHSYDFGFKRVRFDLALKKYKPTTPAKQGEPITFDIEIFNQSEIGVDVQAVEITDYINLAAYDFDPALNPGWTLTGNKAKYIYTGTLAAQTSDIVQITLTVKYGALEMDLKNEAEISGFKDMDGEPQTEEKDSYPDDNPDNDNDVECGSADDDYIGGNVKENPGDDEDDNDISCVDIFDLALKKEETSTGPYKYGDAVTFTYTIYNQGNIAATNIEVTDYVPSGFKYDPAMNGSWSQGQTSTPKTTITTSLNPGESTTVTLVLIAQYTADQINGWTNVAEISKGEDTNGNDWSDYDWDSILDDNPDNDAGGKADSSSDDTVDGDGTGAPGDTDPATDEDDSDPARVKIYDLALRKVLLTDGLYQYYDDLTFEITVYNQGNEEMTEIEVSDYIPAGYTYDPGQNGGWNGASPTVTRVIPGPLGVGDSAKVQLVLKLVQTNGGESNWDNYAEISSMKDSQGTIADSWDADSTPGSDSTHERAVNPGDSDDDKIDGHYIPEGTDEDDHDPAGIPVLDLALIKTTTVVPPFQYDQIVEFTFTIFNQGNEIAHDIHIMDYVPSGFIYLPHLNNDWTQALTDFPETVIAGNLEPGETTTVTLKLQFQYTPEVGGYINKAEITSALDEDNEPFEDIDSKPDQDPDNDVGGTPLTPEDDNVSDDGKDGDGDGVTDEDDEDPWTVEVASIGNYVWYDDNDNGIQDDGMPSTVGVEGVTVILQDCNGVEILRTTTDENGHYDFSNLIPGDYLIVFEDLPENSIWAKQNEGGNDALDSDADENGVSSCTNLEAGEDDPTWDSGILRLSSLGDYVWLDADADGVQDTEESSISGVVVNLLDSQGNIIETTMTDEQGYYVFDSLRPGTYIVQFENPGGLDYSPEGQGGDIDKDSDANPADGGKTGPISLGADEDRRDIDAGFTCTLEVSVSPEETICEGETIDLTVNIEGGEDPKTIIWTTGETTTTISVTPSNSTVYGVTVTDKYGCEDSGEVTVTVEPKAKIGDYVWLDLDRDGIQDFYIQDPDLDEPGINGVTVNLYKASDPNTIFMTQLTHVNADTSGYYEFEVCSGDYFVEFIAPTGQGYILTQQDQGVDDALDSDADENTGRTIATHLDPGEVDHTWDAGYYKTTSLGDYVWHDIDADGIQDPGEEGIDGVEVTLHRGDGSIVSTTTTANGGFYEFTDLLPDDYYICFDYSGTIYTQVSPQNQGYDDESDSDVDPVGGCTEITTLVSGENDASWDMGLYTLASLGDYVWYDKDADGCQDADEEGIGGVIVRLYEDNDANGVPDGSELSNTVTDGTGFYQFTELSAGTYIVKFEKPNSDYKVSPKNHNGSGGCDDTSDSDGDVIFGYSDPVELSDNVHDPTIDQGYYESARLGDYVWYDIDGDGIQDAGEQGVSGVTVSLYKDTDGDGEPDSAVDTKVTNTGVEVGSYVFEDVDPGIYKICFDTNGEYDGFTKSNEGGSDGLDSDADEDTGCTEIIVVESGDDDMTWDAGLIKYAELGDYVWEDENADGYQDPTEPPIEGVLVILEDGQGNKLDTTYTDADGKYIFEQLFPGDYIVHFEKPIGYDATEKDAVVSDTRDSDADKVSGDSHVVTLAAGDSDKTIDAGYYKPAELGDYVWHDIDADGIQDPDEDGVNGISVTLYDSNGTPVENTTTGINPSTGEGGYYKFVDMKPGNYYVCFDKGSWDKFSPRDSGTDNMLDSDADPQGGCTELTVLESGENDVSWDAGLYDYASLGDYVWFDADADGEQDGGESGINDMEVKLYKDIDGDCNPDGAPIATTMTTTHLGNGGYYIFDNLDPGDYVVFFSPSTIYERTDANVGDDTKDSDADEITGMTDCVNLESGEHDPSLDAGYYYSSGIGDYTWFDADGDGVQDGTEKCMDSIKVILYKVNEIAPGVLDTVKVDSTYSHAVLSGQDTLKCGFYEFTKLKPGDYILEFENPDTMEYLISPQDKLYNDAKDSDIDGGGFTTTVTLEPGEYDPTIDAGFYIGDCLEGIVWEDRPAGYYELDPNGDTIFTIVDVYDVFDFPLEGIEVKLYSDPNEFDPNDDVLYKTTITNSEGIYHFDNIEIGTYYLVLVLPDSLQTVNNDVGGDDEVDNDFYLSEETGEYRSQTFAMEADNDEECKTNIDGGTKKKGQTQPLDMLAYEVRYNKSEQLVDIVWNTMNEINSDYYVVERKEEGTERYIEVAEVEAKGLRTLNNYGLKDPNIEGGNRYYYKLTGYDKDGQENGVYIENVLIPANKFTVQAYPNPVNERLYVVLSGNRGKESTIQVIDGIGRKSVKTIRLDNGSNYEKVSIDMSQLPQGQYYIKVISGDQIEIKKVVHMN